MKAVKFIGSLVCGLSAFVLSAASSRAQSVTWGTSTNMVSPTAFLSDGTPDSTEILVWQLGYFTDGFSPTPANVLSWAANWNPVGTTSYVNSGDNEQPFWSASQTYPINAAALVPAAIGKQEWTFVYNSLGALGTTAGEALLYSDGQFFPTAIPAAANTFDIADNPNDTIDDNFTLVWGALDRRLDIAGGYSIANDPTGTQFMSAPHAESNTGPGNELLATFEAQTATWSTNVPEASTAMLGILGSTLLMGRRRRF